MSNHSDGFELRWCLLIFVIVTGFFFFFAFVLDLVLLLDGASVVIHLGKASSSLILREDESAG